jgi:hypothetical protein
MGRIEVLQSECERTGTFLCTGIFAQVSFNRKACDSVAVWGSIRPVGASIRLSI